MSWDGSKMYMMALNVQNSGAGEVRIVDMDGSGATTLTGMTASHHDLTAIPGGFATLLWNSSGMDAPCSLVERADSGTMTTDRRQHEHRLQLEHLAHQLDPLLPVGQHVHARRSQPEPVREDRRAPGS